MLAVRASHSLGVVVVVVVVSGGTIGAVGARGAQWLIVLEVRVIDR